ncbi:MAG: 1-deoxy-D-xylulose-5-phosphate reductoisomerase [Burkholderiales bacterium]
MASPQNVTILGATGSVGVSTLDVIARHPERFNAFALTAHRQVDALEQQILRFKPRYAVVAGARDAGELQKRIREQSVTTEVLYGTDALQQVASDTAVDAVMAAIVGGAGLPPTLAAAQAGKRVLLANKEALVMAGAIFMDAVKRCHATLIPIDSEHNAIFQVLPRNRQSGLASAGIKRILLTASGGPFYRNPELDLERVTPQQATAHPNWVMGRKISVDSATMMNTGLEVIEAHWLFDAAPEQIQVVIHPQSVIHSMVEYVDGSVLAQLGHPDMRTPIAYGLGYPERIDAGVNGLDIFNMADLSFHPPDMRRFPCLALAFEALKSGGSAPITLNAANEVAVAAFLDGRISFAAIARLIERTLNRVETSEVRALDDVLVTDREARAIAQQLLPSS